LKLHHTDAGELWNFPQCGSMLTEWPLH